MEGIAGIGVTVALLLGCIVIFIQMTAGMFLDQKFVKLGTLTGRARQEIVDAVGNPNVITQLEDNSSVQEWISPRYSISLKFIGETCVGVVHERKA